MSIKIKTLNDGSIGIIEIRSSLTGEEEIDDLREAVSDFIEQGIKNLIIDLARVNLITSVGLGALISAHTSFSKNGGEMILANVGKSIKNIFIITKLTEVFEICNTTKDAIEKFSLSTIN